MSFLFLNNSTAFFLGVNPLRLTQYSAAVPASKNGTHRARICVSVA